MQMSKYICKNEDIYLLKVIFRFLPNLHIYLYFGNFDFFRKKVQLKEFLFCKFI